MNFIAYYRVSTKEQGQSGLGLESQKRDVLKYIKSVGGNVAGEYTDIASGSIDERIELNKAIIACEQHNATLVVKKLDRLSRNGFSIALRLEDLKINYIESDSPNDTQLLKDIKLGISKDERQRICERTKAALESIKKQIETQGYYITKEGNRITSLGTTTNLTQAGRVKGGKAAIIRAASNQNNRRAKGFSNLLRAKGMTLQQIADELNTNGFKTSRNKEFNPIQVSRLLK